ncbi:MAG: sigma-70 family RNA polymerase sigma factor [Candidatus Tectomicrobia bacterium]|nr:sigma-70 family RNA polymerase sigma factor [Candidatus Tectomicrobia bacterium]
MAEASFSDQELLRECLRGNRIAWDYLVRKYAGLIYRTIDQTLRSSNCFHATDDLPDLLNSVLLSLFDNDCKKLRQFRGKNGCSLASWIRIVTVRYTIDQMRKFRETEALQEHDSVTHHSPEDKVNQAEQREMLRRLMGKLTVKEQLFVHYYYDQELPPEEVATAMNLLVGTVYSMKNRVREKLKRIIHEHDYVKEKT